MKDKYISSKIHCPYCGEIIMKTAKICRYCNRNVDKPDNPKNKYLRVIAIVLSILSIHLLVALIGLSILLIKQEDEVRIAEKTIVDEQTSVSKIQTTIIGNTNLINTISRSDLSSSGRILRGNIRFSGVRKDPFSTLLTLYSWKHFQGTEYAVRSDNNGDYYFENIAKGEYSIYIMLTENKSMISGCSDVVAPDRNWETALYVPEMTIMDEYLSLGSAISKKGLDGLTRVDFASPPINLESQILTTFDIILYCK